MLLIEHCFSFKVNLRVAKGLLVCNVSCSFNDFEMLFDTLLPFLTPHAPIIISIWFEV